ncbi:16S rRNA (guanine(966)-N(2))-methyltransferase RsmD [Paraferrimonas sp. SM1919]|uniref:16S rRNA (guanine(966)-N(2))-methyltransferase RsmD n=1 Tax=Paraferrimonas sp. SM1919 TaxID=2662263 RepID=UPI0013D2F9A0|nr:16S rRNA (guanine(966)-N(2))-methyltransferase RsmD [Paraferrimonas sp. SM1919]
MKQARSPKKSMGSGQIRIISGQWRGRKLPIHDLEGLRPTTDRVKETVFNWLAPYMLNAKVLDAFSGSGSLGFEALSRYASHATFFELQRQAAQQLKSNLALLNCSNAEVVQTDTLKQLLTPPEQAFDLIFIDPPFNKGLVEPCLKYIAQNKWLTSDGIIYLEIEKQLQLPQLPVNWQIIKDKTAGQVRFLIIANQA